MRITLVGALAIAGVALLVLVLLNLSRSNSEKPDDPPRSPEERKLPNPLGLSAGNRQPGS